MRRDRDDNSNDRGRRDDSGSSHNKRDKGESFEHNRDRLRDVVDTLSPPRRPDRGNGDGSENG